MLLIIHILIALSSLLVAGLAYFRPSAGRLHASYALVFLTVATGTVLTVSLPAHLMQSCVTGLMYLSVVFVAIFAARLKLIQK